MWTINGTQIIVTDRSEGMKQIIAKLQPLSDRSVYHQFGYESPTVKLGCFVIGNADKTTIKNLIINQTDITLVTYSGTYSGAKLSSADFTDVYSICQTLRTDLPTDSPVYRTTLELYLDE